MIFLVSLVFGTLNQISILLSCLILSTIVLLYSIVFRKKLHKNFNKIIKEIKKVRKKDFLKSSFFIYLFITLLWIITFARGLRIDEYDSIRCIDGFCCDAPFHMAITNSFVYKNNFPPKYPLYYETKMVYPFLNDFYSSILIKGGLGLVSSIMIPDILLIYCITSSVYIFFKEVFKKEDKTILISLLIFFFGGIGFMNIISAIFNISMGPTQLSLDNKNLINSINGVVSYPYFNFTEIFTNIFVPQRSYLIGFPLVVLILWIYYKYFENIELKHLLVLSIPYGLLPMFHAHSFIFISIMTAFIFLSDLKRNFRIYSMFNEKSFKLIKKWIVFGCIVFILSFPQLLWILTQNKQPHFFSFVINDAHWKLNNNLKNPLLNGIVFWIRVMGIPILLAPFGYILMDKKTRKYFIPIILVFLAMSVVRLQPSFGDNNKLTLYFFMFISMMSGKFLSKLFSWNILSKFIVILLIFMICIHSPFYFRQNLFISRQFIFSSFEREVADWIIKNTKSNSIFLTEDTSNHLVPSLAGRQVIKGVYAWNLGLESPEIEHDIKEIYSNGNCRLIRKYDIDYIYIGSDERNIATFDFRNSPNFGLVYSNNFKDNNFEIYKVLC
ncbi:MAG: hypothetical protein ISS48_01165 [Candidatus Aenigmarchaeota archaeon]|nr:hypothetical protein [Candidatus Aenigmarchaeota archaeon]